MKIRRALVTGASGFIGQPLVRALAQAGYAVRVAVRRPVLFPSSVDVVIISDLQHFNDWNPILQGVDIVIHLAGLAHADQRDISYSSHDQINRLATHVLANAAKKAGIKRFVYISSVRAQVGASAAQAVHEQDEPHPTDNYGRSKLAAEFAVIETKIPFTILRPVVVYGPHAKGNFRGLIRIASLPWPLPFKAFDNRRSILGIDNLISAIIFVLNCPATVGETFLVADPAPFTLQELITMLRKARGRSPRLIYFPQFLIRLAAILSGRTNLWQRLSEDLIVDCTKLRSLGWHPPVESYEGLRSAVSAENSERDGAKDSHPNVPPLDQGPKLLEN